MGWVVLLMLLFFLKFYQVKIIMDHWTAECWEYVLELFNEKNISKLFGKKYPRKHVHVPGPVWCHCKRIQDPLPSTISHGIFISFRGNIAVLIFLIQISASKSTLRPELRLRRLGSPSFSKKTCIKDPPKIGIGYEPPKRYLEQKQHSNDFPLLIVVMVEIWAINQLRYVLVGEIYHSWQQVLILLIHSRRWSPNSFHHQLGIVHWFLSGWLCQSRTRAAPWRAHLTQPIPSSLAQNFDPEI